MGIFPLKRFLMGCSEVSETLVKLEWFGISAYLCAAEMTNFLSLSASELSTSSDGNAFTSRKKTRTLRWTAVSTRSDHGDAQL